MKPVIAAYDGTPYFTPEGYRELGKRHAETMLALLGLKPSKAEKRVGLVS